MRKRVGLLRKENFGGRLFVAYGCSLGGSFVGQHVQHKNIHLEHGFIGSSDLDQSGKVKAWLMTKLFGGMMVKMLQTGKYPWYMKKGFEKNLETEYGRKFYEMLGIGKGGCPLWTTTFLSVLFYLSSIIIYPANNFNTQN